MDTVASTVVEFYEEYGKAVNTDDGNETATDPVTCQGSSLGLLATPGAPAGADVGTAIGSETPRLGRQVVVHPRV